MDRSSAPAKAAADDLDRLVERWFFEAFHGSPVARATEAWNHAFAAKEELKARLTAFVASLKAD